METTKDVLRQHGLHDLADWAENPVLAPAYARVSAYWVSVLSAPDFQQPDFQQACEFEFDPEPEPELPEPELPVLPAIFADIPCSWFLNTAQNSPPPVPLGMRPCRIYRPNQPTTGGRSRVDF